MRIRTVNVSPFVREVRVGNFIYGDIEGVRREWRPWVIVAFWVVVIVGSILLAEAVKINNYALNS